MDHLAVTAQAAESYWHILVKFNGHLESHTQDYCLCWQHAQNWFPGTERKMISWLTRAQRSLTCLISQLTFHCFMLANLHVVTGKPEDMSIRIRRLYEIPRISSFLLPLNLKCRYKMIYKWHQAYLYLYREIIAKYICCTWQCSSWYQTLEETARPG